MTHTATIPIPAAKEPLPGILDKDTGSEPARPGFALKNLNFRKLLMAGAALVVLAGAVNYGWDYWTVGQYLVSTDDAYVKADSTTVAPKISGYLREVLVGDNERVKAGQVLARVDERDFRVALDQAKADVAATRAVDLARKAAEGFPSSEWLGNALLVRAKIRNDPAEEMQARKQLAESVGP